MKRLMLFVWAIALTSCATPSVASNPTQKRAITIAEQRAKDEGVDLPRYRLAKATEKNENGRSVWRVAYVLKGTARPGAFFDVEVDIESSVSRFHPGR